MALSAPGVREDERRERQHLRLALPIPQPHLHQGQTSNNEQPQQTFGPGEDCECLTVLWLAGEQAGGQGGQETAQGDGAPQDAADVFLSGRAGE